MIIPHLSITHFADLANPSASIIKYAYIKGQGIHLRFLQYRHFALLLHFVKDANFKY
jgi:hypothetical protein